MCKSRLRSLCLSLLELQGHPLRDDRIKYSHWLSTSVETLYAAVSTNLLASAAERSADAIQSDAIEVCTSSVNTDEILNISSRGNNDDYSRLRCFTADVRLLKSPQMPLTNPIPEF